ncbi:MAG: hypothetical protein ABSE05_08530 [Syntrophales bacterium]|jgi:hypothetical protein
MDMKLTSRVWNWPVYGWLGSVLAVTLWILNWCLSGLRTQWGFFPMWLGYCLTVDAMVFTRKGHSLLTRSPSSYAVLFLISVSAWWLFEIINLRTQNWYYLGEQYFSDAEYFLYSSLSFSTVMPAVFGTAELAGTFTWINRTKSNLRLEVTPDRLIALFATGLIMMLLMLIWPNYFFCFVWLSVYLMLEPLNAWLKNRTLLQYISTGNWQPLLALWVGCIICGFFWEMWNFYSYPKWIYYIPFFNFLHIFEMPLLGYLGYLPFSMELFALYHFTIGLLKSGRAEDYIQI